MKHLLLIVLLWPLATLKAQLTEVEKLVATVQEFHQALVNKNSISLNQQTDKALSYGHSNGWVQDKKELIADLQSGKINYQQFTTDSMVTHINGTMANVRFKATVDASMNGVNSSFKLRVLEVWVKKSSRWLLFSRQAVKQ
jgi:hypothetical protein